MRRETVVIVISINRREVSVCECSANMKKDAGAEDTMERALDAIMHRIRIGYKLSVERKGISVKEFITKNRRIEEVREGVK